MLPQQDAAPLTRLEQWLHASVASAQDSRDGKKHTCPAVARRTHAAGNPASSAHLFLHALLLQHTMALVPSSPAGAVLVDAHNPDLLGRQFLHLHSLQMLLLLPAPLVPPLPAAVVARLLLEHTRRLLSSPTLPLLLPLNKLEMLNIPAPAKAPAHTHSLMCSSTVTVKGMAGS
jgi:hypothetical protein